jgi:hypothetical protein
MNPFAETRDNPDKPAIIVGDNVMSYRELDATSRVAAAALRERGLTRGRSRSRAPAAALHALKFSFDPQKDEAKLMTATREDLIACLHVKGFGKTTALAEALGAPAEAVEAAVAEMVAGGEAEQFRVGVRLSATGKAAAEQRLAEERAGADQRRLEEQYERFTPLNAAFKALVSDWQMRPGDGKLVRNDHKDEAYDAAVLGRLPELHASAVALIDDIAAHAPRIGGYRRRFSDALAKIQAGDHRYITAPDCDSYHTVWFELHQHLINLLGRTRQQEAAAGRAV